MRKPTKIIIKHDRTRTLLAKKENEMTDRDFKLLVREYFQIINKSEHGGVIHHYQCRQQAKKIESKILSQLEDFTRKDVEELPFKD